MNRSERAQAQRDRIKQDAVASQSKGADYLGNSKFPIKTLNLKTGTHFLDFMPYDVTMEGSPHKVIPGDIWYRRSILLHRNIGSENIKLVCPKTFGKDKPCPICAHRNYLQGLGDPSMDALISSIKHHERTLFNVVDLNNSSVGTQILDAGDFLFTNLMMKEVNENDDFLYFTELEGGYQVKIRMDESSFQGRSFPKAGRFDFIPRDYTYPEAAMQAVHDLDAIIIVQPYEEIKELFFEGEEPPVAGATTVSVPGAVAGAAPAANSVASFMPAGAVPSGTAPGAAAVSPPALATTQPAAPPASVPAAQQAAPGPVAQQAVPAPAAQQAAAPAPATPGVITRDPMPEQKANEAPTQTAPLATAPQRTNPPGTVAAQAPPAAPPAGIQRSAPAGAAITQPTEIPTPPKKAPPGPTGYEPCIACQETGVPSNGIGDCFPCKGFGWLTVQAPPAQQPPAQPPAVSPQAVAPPAATPPQEAPVNQVPAPAAQVPVQQQAATPGGTCPDPAGTFGVSTNDIPACTACPLWEACADRKFGDTVPF